MVKILKGDYPLNTAIKFNVKTCQADFSYPRKPTAGYQLLNFYAFYQPVCYIVLLPALFVWGQCISYLSRQGLYSQFFRWVLTNNAGNSSYSLVIYILIVCIYIYIFYFYVLPLIFASFTLYLWPKSGWIRHYFPIWQSMFHNFLRKPKIIHIEKLNAKRYVIPLFKNIMLDYKAEGDFADKLEWINIKPIDVSDYRRSNGKPFKPNDSHWMAEFLFSAIPKDGYLHIRFN